MAFKMKRRYLKWCSYKKPHWNQRQTDPKEYTSLQFFLICEGDSTFLVVFAKKSVQSVLGLQWETVTLTLSTRTQQSASLLAMKTIIQFRWGKGLSEANKEYAAIHTAGVVGAETLLSKLFSPGLATPKNSLADCALNRRNRTKVNMW